MPYLGIRQLQIIHLSDIHFGDNNIFNPEHSIAGDIPATKRYPTLFEKLKEDLARWNYIDPTILAITGDLTENGDFEDYDKCKTFINAIINDGFLGKNFKKDRVFVVPGNHDMLYEKSDKRARTHEWVNFANDLTGRNLVLPEHDEVFPYIDIHNRHDDLGAIILTLNSSIYVQKDTTDEDRGVLGFDQRDFFGKQLEKIPKDILQDSIRIALVHHHPVLIPEFIESMRGYDAIADSGDLIGLLQVNGFHLILHGHKHNPYIYTIDTRSAFEDITKKPMVIAAGGSLGSKDLPEHPLKTNTYNIIKVCWNPKASHYRINIMTRGLVRFRDDGRALNPIDWTWKTLSSYDESFFAYERFPIRTTAQSTDYSDEYKTLEKRRIKKYAQTRGYFPVYELRPSLDVKNSYEVILWLEHDDQYGDKENAPEEVEWYTDNKSPILRVSWKQDPSFSVQLNYHAPFLVHAIMKFPDGVYNYAYAFVRIPMNY
jgi:3',5'-cyclic AMP phosphodiesterase CpdA